VRVVLPWPTMSNAPSAISVNQLSTIRVTVIQRRS
jgi:hypothetical protein